MRIETFIIHLKRAKQRRAHVDRVIGELPFKGHIVEAVDGLTITDDDINQHYQRKLHKPSYPFKMSRNEVACFISHRKAWQKIVDSDIDAALVMEDDAQPAEGFNEGLDLAIKHMGSMGRPGFIRFPFRGWA